MADHHPIGKPFDEDNRPSIFTLDLSQHLPSIDPEKFGLNTEDTNCLNPYSYFITSGDALYKAMQLEKDLWALSGDLRKNISKKDDKKYKEYISAVWSCAGKCRTLVNTLRHAKGTHCFFETEWTAESILLCVPKDPKAKGKINE